MNPIQKEASRRDSEQSWGQDQNSEQFHYNPDNERYIGKRTGLLFRRVNPKQNFDGFPRLSEYESYGGRDSASLARDSDLQQIQAENAAIQKSKLQKTKGPIQNSLVQHESHTAPRVQSKQHLQDSSSSFVYQPASFQANTNSLNNHSSRIPDINVPSFSNISTIKRRITEGGRRSQVDSYAKLIDNLKEDNLDEFIVNEELLNDLSTFQQHSQIQEGKRQHQLQQENKDKKGINGDKKGINGDKKKRNTNRVSFNTKKITPIQYIVDSSRLTENYVNSMKKNIDPSLNSNEDPLVVRQATQNFLKKLEQSHRKILQDEKRGCENEEKKRARHESQLKRKQQERKSKLMKAFRLTQDKLQNKDEVLEKFTHKKISDRKTQNAEVYEKQTKKIKSIEKQSKKQKQQSFKYQGGQYQNQFWGRKNEQSNSKNRERKEKYEKKAENQKKQAQMIRKKNIENSKPKRNKKNRQSTRQKRENRSIKSKNKKRGKQEHSKQSEIVTKAIKQKNQMKNGNIYGEQDDQPYQEGNQVISDREAKGKRKKVTIVAIQDSQQKQLQKPKKIRKISENEYIKIITEQSSSQQLQQGRYPKRCRVKPTKYWELEKVNYRTGKVVGISHAQLDFLELIGADSTLETTTNINFENTNFQAQIFMPSTKNICCRGYSDPYKRLEISLAEKDIMSSQVKKSQVTLDDGIQIKDLKSHKKLIVDPDRVFTIENGSKKQITLLMHLSC